jgi:hypothetical protein
VNDQTERPWFCFQLPDAISFAPGATEDDARDVMRKNSYAGAPVDSWPCLGSRFCSREALTRSLMRPRATDSVSPAPEARWPKYVQEQFGKRCASCHYANGHHQDTCPNLPSDWDPEYTHLAPYSADVLIADNGTRSVDPNTVPRPSEACPDCCAYTNEPCGKHEQRSNEAQIEAVTVPREGSRTLAVNGGLVSLEWSGDASMRTIAEAGQKLVDSLKPRPDKARLSPTKTSADARRRVRADLRERALGFLNGEWDAEEETGGDRLVAVLHLLESVWNDAFEAALAMPCEHANRTETAVHPNAERVLALLVQRVGGSAKMTKNDLERASQLQIRWVDNGHTIHVTAVSDT